MFRMIVCLLLLMTALPHVAMANGTAVPPPNIAPKGVTQNATGTPIDNAAANKLYLSCVNDPFKFQRLNPISKDMLCSCLSAGYQSEMTVEDMEQMKKTTTPEGKAVYARMLKKVYFPCAMPPLEESLNEECSKRAAAGNMGRQSTSACRCVLKRMTEYTNKLGIPHLQYSAETTGQIGEPFDVLVNGGDYSRTLIESYYTCFNGRVP